MKHVLKHAALVSALMAATSAHATNGYFLPGFGMKAMGMGGAGIAAPQDAISAAYNPANLSKVGMRGDIGISVFDPVRSAYVGKSSSSGDSSFFGFDTGSESDQEWFLVPEMGFSMPLTEQLSAGIAVVGNGGMNTTYLRDYFDATLNDTAGLGKLGVDMMQLLVPVSVSYKLNEDHAVGASVVGAVTRFRAYGLQNFRPISSDPDHLTNNGFDYSYGGGIKLGWLGDFFDDRLNVGLSWTSRMYMTKLDAYRGLFAEQGGFDIPENYGLGIAFKPTKSLTLAADVSRILFSEVKAFGNRGPSFDTDPGFLGIPSGFGCGSGGDPAKCLGEDAGMGFGWSDQTVYKVGADWKVNDSWIVRAGYNYGATPIKNDQLTFNTLAPATVEHHYSVGFTWKSSDSPMEITGAYMYAHKNEQRAVDQNIVGGADIEMSQHVLGVSLGWVLDEGVGLH
ncbi:MAG: outer membrane protein transport protein [Polynucleobacter sp.]|nr:outer membrane protein transport protein [Gammaproteobacteria bacterium]MDO9014012.1 outer membrane protein transport protein [Polynucleobacter sp.]